MESNILKLFLKDAISITILPAIMEELYTSKIFLPWLLMDVTSTTILSKMGLVELYMHHP